jgi:lipopolysaccharide/colanic/teichoic acid biosynthesis glycosyltransferase
MSQSISKSSLETGFHAASLGRVMHRWIKRAFDFCTSLMGLILLAPLFIVVAILIKRNSPGPVFFRGIRVGKDLKLFQILKFRTMRETHEAYQGPKITAEGDVRITKLGRFLRDSKINELPQLINVLKGEMSLVGPRPEDPTFVEHYSEEQREVLSVRPGITSLASVIYADEEKLLQVDNVTDTYLRSILPKKLRLDLLYVRNRTLFLDLDILFRTFWIFIPRFRKATLNAEDILLGPFRWLRVLVTWFTIDAAISSLAVLSAALIFRAAGPIDVGIPRMAGAALVMTVIFTITNALFGVQKVWWRYASASESIGLVLSVISATLILLFINTFIPPPNLPPALLILSGVFALVGFGGMRYRRKLQEALRFRTMRFRSASKLAREKVLVVGAGEAGQLTLWLLQNSPAGQAFHVVGVVDDNLEKIGSLIHRVPVLGRTIRIPQIVAEQDIGLIIFAIHTIDPRKRHTILQMCWKSGVRTFVAPDILTFLRKGEGPADQRTWVPDLNHLDENGEDRKQFEGKEVKETIHELSELARHGEYAKLTQALEQLDRELNATQQEEPGEIEQVPVDAEVSQPAVGSD